jgi:hypothetical protein
MEALGETIAALAPYTLQPRATAAKQVAFIATQFTIRSSVDWVD